MVQIEVRGAAAVTEAIFRLDKELWKELQQDVKKAGDVAAKEAGQNMPARPLRNWGKWIEFSGRGNYLYYESGSVRAFKSGFRSKSRGGFREVYSVISPAKSNVAGAIFLLAGSVDGTKSQHPQGRERSARFKRRLNLDHGGNKWPRVLSPLYYKHRKKIREEVGKAVESATAKFNRS